MFKHGVEQKNAARLCELLSDILIFAPCLVGETIGPVDEVVGKEKPNQWHTGGGQKSVSATPMGIIADRPKRGRVWEKFRKCVNNYLWKPVFAYHGNT